MLFLSGTTATWQKIFLFLKDNFHSDKLFIQNLESCKKKKKKKNHINIYSILSLFACISFNKSL